MKMFKSCGCDSYGGTCPACLAGEAQKKVTCVHGHEGNCQLCLKEASWVESKLISAGIRLPPSVPDSALATQVGGDHYKSCKIQPIEYIEANALGFLEACVVKRVTRHNKATGKGRQDIEKAIHELQLLLELRYPTASC